MNDEIFIAGWEGGTKALVLIRGMKSALALFEEGAKVEGSWGS
jgi:hypothetical protein